MDRMFALRLAAAHLPLHEFAEGAVGILAEFDVGALLGDFAVGGQDDDAVGAFDGGEAVGDGDGCVVAFEELAERLVDEGFGFGVQGGCCWIDIVSILGGQIMGLNWNYLRLRSKYRGS